MFYTCVLTAACSGAMYKWTQAPRLFPSSFAGSCFICCNSEMANTVFPASKPFIQYFGDFRTKEALFSLSCVLTRHHLFRQTFSAFVFLDNGTYLHPWIRRPRRSMLAPTHAFIPATERGEILFQVLYHAFSHVFAVLASLTLTFSLCMYYRSAKDGAQDSSWIDIACFRLAQLPPNTKKPKTRCRTG